MTSDTDSTFLSESGETHSFSLSLLTEAVSEYFQTSCQLVKLAEGGYHKVYDIVRSDTIDLDAVVRVVSPAFPKDKLESEVATIQYLALHTSVPVPKIYSWNSDASNPTGVEYMIMEKVSGVPADSVINSLSDAAIKRFIAEIAAYMHEMFLLCFEQAGSLYLSPTPEKFIVGPIISTPFYHSLDGFIRIEDTSLISTLNRLRGPFSTVSDYLSSWVKAELCVISQNPSTALLELGGNRECLKLGQRILEKLSKLCEIYPGDTNVYGGVTMTSQRFSLKLDDFHLSNIMIDECSGKVISLIDLEGATIAPVWDCATIPNWILPSNLDESTFDGFPKDTREELCRQFLERMDHLDHSGEWWLAYTKGRPFRLLVDRLRFQVGVWACKSSEFWVDDRLKWAKLYPGVGFHDDSIEDRWVVGKRRKERNGTERNDSNSFLLFFFFKFAVEHLSRTVFAYLHATKACLLVFTIWSWLSLLLGFLANPDDNRDIRMIP